MFHSFNRSHAKEHKTIIRILQDCLILQDQLMTVGSRLANEIQCSQMSLNESDSASASQTNSLRLCTSQSNFGNVQSAKYFSITIADNMDWGQHVSEISSKATKTLVFLRRNLAFAPRRSKEVACKTLVRPKLEYAALVWSPHSKLQINQIAKVQRTAARWTCKRWRNTSSIGEMLDEIEWSSLEARRDQSSLLLFHKIHCGAVSIEKDKYMTPAHNLKTTRSSHSAQYHRHQTYSDALNNYLFPPNYSTLE